MADYVGALGSYPGRETHIKFGSGSTLQGATSLATIGIAWRSLAPSPRGPTHANTTPC